MGSFDEAFLADAALGRLGSAGSVFGQRNALDLGHRLAVVEFHFELFLIVIGGAVDLQRVDDGGVAGFGLGCGARRERRGRLAEFRHSEGDGADCQLVAVLQRLFAGDALAVDECPIGAAQVAEHELSPDLVELAMAAANLCRLDADDTIVVAPEAGDVVGQFERGGGASAPHDLEYIIHRRWPVGFRDAADEMIRLMESHRM